MLVLQVLFYCHFPDQLLARHRKGIYSWYRAALNTFEELSTGQAHQILVNSRFTQGLFLVANNS
jgi:alpha-1,3/alpha-1,6-mannosyltransferase